MLVHQWPSKSSSTQKRRPPNRSKSNSQRGKEFRAKRKEYETGLESEVHELRAYVAKLHRTKMLNDSQLLQTPFCESGSWTKTLREYFSLYRFGLYDTSSEYLPAASPSLIRIIQRQEDFLHANMDEQAIVSEQAETCNKYGPSASLEQWRLHTLAHYPLKVETVRMETIHSEEYAIIKVYTHIHGRFSHNTFRVMYPTALEYPELMDKFLHREVVFDTVFQFEFTESGLIHTESADCGEFAALLNAGFAFNEVVELMKHCILCPGNIYPSPNMKQLEMEPQDAQPADKFDVKFLLS